MNSDIGRTNQIYEAWRFFFNAYGDAVMDQSIIDSGESSFIEPIIFTNICQTIQKTVKKTL